jgi:integrase
MKGDGRVYQRGPIWWLDYYVGDRRFREPGGRSQREALKKLRARRAAALCDQFVPPEQERVTVVELLDALRTHLEIRGSKSLGAFGSHSKPVREAFGHLRASRVTSAQLEEYARSRQETGKANATINRGLQGLRAAFNLARRQGRLSRVPHFPMLKEDNVRRGFFEVEEFEAVVSNLPEPIADIARFAYLTGWRKGELTGLR